MQFLARFGVAIAGAGYESLATRAAARSGAGASLPLGEARRRAIEPKLPRWTVVQVRAALGRADGERLPARVDLSGADSGMDSGSLL